MALPRHYVPGRGRTRARQGTQLPQLLATMPRFLGITNPKFLPARRIASEPLPQRSAGCKILCPLIHGCVDFHAAWPQSVDQYARVPSSWAGGSYTRFILTSLALTLLFIDIAP